MKTTRVMAGLLAGAMVFGLGTVYAPSIGTSITAQAEAEGEYCEKCGNYYACYLQTTDTKEWRFIGLRLSADSNSGELVKSDIETVTDVEIKSSINGEPVTAIGRNAFFNFTALTSVSIPSSVTTIEEFAFAYCSSLKSIDLQNSVTKIGNQAFSNCAALTTVKNASAVTTIGERAFNGCDSLPSVSLGDSVMTVGLGAFMNCRSLASIKVSANNLVFTSVDGVLFTADKKRLAQFPAGKDAASYTVPDSVTTINAYAFYGCNRLKSLIIPATVKTINTDAIGINSAGQIMTDLVIYGEYNTPAEDYALSKKITFKEIPAEEPTEEPTEPEKPTQSGVVGDINGDGTVNASDAACILIYAAAVGAGYEGTLPEYFAAK